MAIVEVLRFDLGIELGHQEGEKSDVVSQWLDQSFSSPFALRIHPSSKRSERGGNFIGYSKVLSIPSTSFPTIAVRVQGSSTFHSHGKTANNGNWPSV